MQGKVIEKRANQAGKLYALVKGADGKGAVLAHCENYNGRARGGISYTWRYVLPRDLGHCDAQTVMREGVPMAEARALFDRSTRGKAR